MTQEKDIYRLQLNNDLNILADKKKITLVVDNEANLFRLILYISRNTAFNEE